MDHYTRTLIEKRAKALGSICERILNFENEADEIAGTGFRWAYLLLRRPKKYLEAFYTGELRIDPSLLNDAMWTYQEELPGPNGMLPEESQLLKEHNEEAARWVQSRSGVIPLVQGKSGTFA
jgi:hypothetical protein